MSQNDPLKSSGTSRIQAMPCREGGAGKTSTDGALIGFSIIECIEDGVFVITYASGGTEPYTRYQGMVKSLSIGDSVTITSGTFDLA